MKALVLQANTVGRLLTDPALCAQISGANREKVREFAPEVVGQHYLSVLGEVVERDGEKCSR